MDLTKNLFKGDKVVWIVFMLLCVISLIEVFSATSTLVYSSGNHWNPIYLHSRHLVIGILFVLVMQHIPLRALKLTPLLVVASWVLLVIVILKADKTNNAARWTNLFGIDFQPSEITKMALTITVALILAFMQEGKGASPKALKYILAFAIPSIMLIAPDNLSTAMLLSAVVFLMMFIGRIPLKQMFKISMLTAILGAAFASFIIFTPADTLQKVPMGHRFTTWQNRIERFSTNDERQELSPKEVDLRNEHMQTNYANIAIASSHIIGKGPGNSKTRDFLPQAYSDFIFAIILEELGLLGGGIVIFLYLILLIRTAKIANKCDKDFPALAAIGVALLIASQAFVNMMVAVGLFPVTGQPLPLISRGGTSIIINCIYIGIILSVSRYNNLQAEKKKALEEGNMLEVQRLENINKGLERETPDSN